MKKFIPTKKIVIPAKAGIQNIFKKLDSRFHGNDLKKKLAQEGYDELS